MNDQPPSDEAVKAAFDFIQGNEDERREAYPAMKAEQREFMDKGHPESVYQTAARIMGAHARALGAEVEDLRSWKASQMAVEREWDCQQVGKLIGAPLGTSIRRHIQQWVETQIAEAERLRAALERIRDHDCNLDAWEVVSAMTNITDEALAGKGER